MHEAMDVSLDLGFPLAVVVLDGSKAASMEGEVQQLLRGHSSL